MPACVLPRHGGGQAAVGTQPVISSLDGPLIDHPEAVGLQQADHLAAGCKLEFGRRLRGHLGPKDLADVDRHEDRQVFRFLHVELGVGRDDDHQPVF